MLSDQRSIFSTPPGSSPVPARATAVHRTGFTLIELMVSIAMVLLLVLGINAVFQAATRTTSSGQALSSVMRDQRSMERRLSADFRAMAGLDRMPCITIHSRIQAAFNDPADMQADRDGNPLTIDLDGDGSEEYTTPTAVYNARNHRIDRVSFFVDNPAQLLMRQTGNQGPNNGPELISSGASREAWIWIGHLRQPRRPLANLPDPRLDSGGANPVSQQQGTMVNTAGDYFDPGQANPGANPNNYFASDWMLGRVAMLLIADPSVAGDAMYAAPLDPSSNPQISLEPLSYNSVARVRQGNNWVVRSWPTGAPGLYSLSQPWQIWQSRFDVAITSLGEYSRRVMYNTTQTGNSSLICGGINDFNNVVIGALDYRFNCDSMPYHPHPNNTPAQIAMGAANQAALAVPFLQRGVTQFMVEYAGDFVTQCPDTTVDVDGDGQVTPGRITDVMPDGEVDFVAQIVGGTLLKKTRWYGMPRNVDTGDDTSSGPVIRGNQGPGVGMVNHLVDVVPLQVVLAAAGLGADRNPRTGRWPAGFEHFYVPSGGAIGMSANYAATLPNNAMYACAWTPAQLADPNEGKPRMIRVVVTVTDPNGRLPEGHTVELVYTLPN